MRRIALFGAVLVCALMAAPAQASYEPENLAEVVRTRGWGSLGVTST
jgi:hypothetical protein